MLDQSTSEIEIGIPLGLIRSPSFSQTFRPHALDGPLDGDVYPVFEAVKPVRKPVGIRLARVILQRLRPAQYRGEAHLVQVGDQIQKCLFFRSGERNR